MMVFMTDATLFDTYGTIDNPKLQPPAFTDDRERNSILHGYYIITERDTYAIKTCPTDKNEDYETAFDILKACGYICDSCPSKVKMGDYCQLSVIWIGLLSIGIISLTSLVGAVFAPFQKSPYYAHFQGMMIALAVGCLTGDAILHLIPMIFGLHGHTHGGEQIEFTEDEGHEDHGLSQSTIRQRGLMIMAGLYVFYVLETIIGIVSNARSRNEPLPGRAQGDCQNPGTHHIAMVDQEECHARPNECDEEKQDVDEESLLDHRHSHAHGHGHGHSHHGAIASVGWMIIVGDGLHNFADGLAIGAAFVSSYTTGLGTVFAVFFHELPHEMGDFAVLLSSGMSVKQACFWNLVSSFTCFLGFFGGVYLGSSSEDIQKWILGIAAGAFIYIALVDMLPEIRMHGSRGNSWVRLTFHQIGLILGGFIMYLMAKYEHVLAHLF